MERYRITRDNSVYYVTFTVMDWLPLFVREETCRIVADSLNFCVRNKGLLVGAYVVMPTHMHAVVADKDADVRRLARTIDDFRKFTGRSLADWCDSRGPEAFRRAIREAATADRNRRVRQPSKHPEAICSEQFLVTKVAYLHNNPVRAGLVRSPEHWRYSSAGYYAGVPECDVEVGAFWW